MSESEQSALTGLSVAVTGGIGAGKSTVAQLLGESGFTVVDSDRLAREVVEPGTDGLRAVVDTFGPELLRDDGSLDRAALAATVFGPGGDERRRQLEHIIHPLVRAGYDAVVRDSAPESVVVNDIPLVRELRVAAGFHLVVGVGVADDTTRLARLVQRGMAESDARARIDAQLGDEARRRLCDVWLDNGGDQAALADAVSGLAQRLRGFAGNRAAERAAPYPSVPRLLAPDPRWADLGALLAARVTAATGRPCAHIGSTSVPGLVAEPTIDLQLAVGSMADADALNVALAGAGFPSQPGEWRDQHLRLDLSPDRLSVAEQSDDGDKRLHGNADPGQTVNLHLRVRNSQGWYWNLLFPAWLRADAAARDEYASLKCRLVEQHRSTAEYSVGKDPWMRAAAARAQRWADETGWVP
ncbi:dephospho-CoA kinase [Nakamurella aerolata]|uniref:dephospho-CoA kinase n=1 Tax=Nakamurella aerolata TaxID=1656892 RepID=UPI0031B5EBDF